MLNIEYFRRLAICKIVIILSFSFGLIAGDCQGQNEKEQSPVQSSPFPRTDGVYRIAKRTRFNGLENRYIFDYIAFKSNRAYVITGDYLPAIVTSPAGDFFVDEKAEGTYYLEKPDRTEPGEFQKLKAPIAAQPQKIREWLNEDESSLPRYGTLKKVEGKFQFTIEEPATRYENAYTLVYSLAKTTDGFRSTKNISWTGGQRTVTADYEFIPFGESAKPLTLTEAQLNADKIVELHDKWRDARTALNQNMLLRAHAEASRNFDSRIPSLTSDVSAATDAERALENFINHLGEKSIQPLQRLAAEGDNEVRPFARRKLNVLNAKFKRSSKNNHRQSDPNS